MTEEKQLCKS